jgi:AraC-like DNA-binding protein
MPGDVLLGDTKRHTISTPEGAAWLSVGLRATAFTSFDLLQPLQPPQVWRPDPASRRLMETHMRALIEYWHGTPDYPAMHPANLGFDAKLAGQHDITTQLICCSLGAALVGQCWQFQRSEGRSVAHDADAPGWLVAALRRFHDDPAVDVAAVARDVGLSPAQFRRSFRHWTGSSPRDHLQQERLRTAQRLLETTDGSIATIARGVGFQSASHFIRLWQRHYGLSPAQHRAAMRGAKV